MHFLPFDVCEIVVIVTSVNFRCPLTLRGPCWKDMQQAALCEVASSCRHIEACVRITLWNFFRLACIVSVTDGMLYILRNA
jgi:hypothetical protein